MARKSFRGTLLLPLVATAYFGARGCLLAESMLWGDERAACASGVVTT